MACTAITFSHRTLEFISSSHHLFSPLVCYHSERPGSPWHCGWPHCWGQHQVDSPGHFGGILGPALHHNHPLPVESVKKWKSPGIPAQFETLKFIFFRLLKLWWAQQTIFLITLDSAVSIGAPVSIDSPNSDIIGIMSNITSYVKHTKYVLRLTRYKRVTQTSTCQGHLHGIGYLLLLCHAAEVWQCCHSTLGLRDGHLQKSFLWFWGREQTALSETGIDFKVKGIGRKNESITDSAF